MMLPETGWRTRADLIRLTEALGAQNKLVRYVGGAVRDALLGALRCLRPAASASRARCSRPKELHAS